MSIAEDEHAEDAESTNQASPNKQLAERIAAELVVQQFTRDKTTKSLVANISTGQMQAENWRVVASASLRTDEADEALPEEQGGEQ